MLRRRRSMSMWEESGDKIVELKEENAKLKEQ